MHIVDLGLTLLHHATLPLQFWDYAFTTAVYLINRLPTASLNFAIPFVTLFNKDLDFHFLKTFGCACFPLLNLIILINSIFVLRNVCFWGTPHLIKAINVCLQLAEFIFLRMCCLMN